MPRKMAREPQAPATETSTRVFRAPSKISLVLNLLRREDGATLPELGEASGWLPRTIRAHLTGLRKKGRVIDRTRRDEASCYRIVEAD